MITAAITLLAYSCVFAPQDSGFAALGGPSSYTPAIQTDDEKAAAKKVLEAGKWLDERKPVHALEALNAAERLSPKEIPDRYWANAYYQSRQFAKVVEWGRTHLYETTMDTTQPQLKSYPTAPLLIYAASLCEVGEWGEAKEIYAAALPQMNYTNGKPKFALAQDLSVLNEPIVKYRFRSAIHAALGMDDGNSVEIHEYELRESLRLYSRNVCANYYLARMLKYQGKDSEVEQYMARAVKYGGKAFANAISGN